jgi:hypothetical protein
VAPICRVSIGAAPTSAANSSGEEKSERKCGMITLLLTYDIVNTRDNHETATDVRCSFGITVTVYSPDIMQLIVAAQ